MSPYGLSITMTEIPGPSEWRTLISTSEFENDDFALLEIRPDNLRGPSLLPGQAEEERLKTEHVIRLSSIDHCMPRAYIRVCLAFRLRPLDSVDKALAGLGHFLRGTV